jgi:hypothetical protein
MQQRLRQVDAARQFGLGKAEQRRAGDGVEGRLHALEGDQEPGNGPRRGRRDDRQRRHPGGHVHREGNQQRHPRDHGRIEQILAETAENLLAQHRREKTAEDADPPRCPGRQRQRQEPAGQHRRSVKRTGATARPRSCRHTASPPAAAPTVIIQR